MKRPADVKLSREEGEALIARVNANELSEDDRQRVVKLIELWFWLSFALTEAKLSVKRLKRLLFGRGRDDDSDDDDRGGSPDSATSSASMPNATQPAAEGTSESTPSSEAATEPKPPRPGHGRQGADAYTGAEVVVCQHETLEVGDRCPACGQGKLYELPSGVELRVDGQALLCAIRYELEKLRCSACGEVFTAALPVAAGEEKYTPQARAVVVVSRYYLGLPFYRLEGFQAAVGVPVADATLWELAEQLADCAYPVFDRLVFDAAQSERFYHDDTPVRIVSAMMENREAAEAAATGQGEGLARTGIQTTGIVAEHGERTIILYFSGRDHAGENLSAVLERRQPGLPKPLVVSDALSANTLQNEAAVIRCHCLYHGRRQFEGLEDDYPQSARVVADLKQVFKIEAHTRKQAMTAQQRLAYHQQHSRPLLDALKPWMEAQLTEREVEPASSLGKAFSYLLNRWPSITRFLTVENAPLDTNAVERALKLMIRQRRNSLFFATAHGAYVGSLLASLIATCLAAGVNVRATAHLRGFLPTANRLSAPPALSYLVALQVHRSAVCRAPEAWLPWNFTAALEAQAT